MEDVDLNLLVALDALLAETSVTGAARRLRLSPSATSRTLARLRAVTGDPLLVRAGRGLVPTPWAAELRDRVQVLARDARDVLSPQSRGLDVTALERDFTIRAGEGFMDLLAAPLEGVCLLPSRANCSSSQMSESLNFCNIWILVGNGLSDSWCPERKADNRVESN